MRAFVLAVVVAISATATAYEARHTKMFLDYPDEPKKPKAIFWVMPSRDPAIQSLMAEKLDYSRQKRQDKIDIALKNRKPRRSYPGGGFVNGQIFIPGLQYFAPVGMARRLNYRPCCSSRRAVLLIGY